ncbi:MAG: NADH-quinone oxidoreductase subunit H, partial [Candidatus Scalindua sp.]|nr:NADH-quinone oxidoreductase subunit H [Candidatus Scalindua sp.]
MTNAIVFAILSTIKIGIVIGVLLLVIAYLIWVERKVMAHMQVRMGPMRVGWHGLLQPIADGLKLITKEDIIPA